MALVGESLSGATAVGPGMSITFDLPKAKHGLTISVTGSPSVAQVSLDGTINGTDWFSIATATLTNMIAFPVSPVAVTATRANLVSLSGGTSPTVTAWIAAA